MRIKIELEFDEQDLGKDWLNPYNLELLLYSKEATKRDLLKILSYKEVQNEFRKKGNNKMNKDYDYNLSIDGLCSHCLKYANSNIPNEVKLCKRCYQIWCIK